MPVLNIRNIGSEGVNSDIEPWDLPPASLTDGINYRLSANKVQSVGGTVPAAQWLATSLATLPRALTSLATLRGFFVARTALSCTTVSSTPTSAVRLGRWSLGSAT